MQKFHIVGRSVPPNAGYSGVQEFYVASDVDARIADLEKALRDALIWNWAEWTSHDPKNPPAELVDRISTLLASKPLMEAMTVRTYEQMYSDAIKALRDLINAGKEAKDGEFRCTQEEYLLIMDRPPFHCYELSSARDRICGLKIVVAAQGKRDE